MDGTELLTQLVIKALAEKEKQELEFYKNMLKIATDALEDLDNGELSTGNITNNISRRALFKINEMKKSLTK